MHPKIWEILAALKELEYMTNALNGPTNALMPWIVVSFRWICKEILEKRTRQRFF